jgi:hypothetical protein
VTDSRKSLPTWRLLQTCASAVPSVCVRRTTSRIAPARSARMPTAPPDSHRIAGRRGADGRRDVARRGPEGGEHSARGRVADCNTRGVGRREGASSGVWTSEGITPTTGHHSTCNQRGDGQRFCGRIASGFGAHGVHMSCVSFYNEEPALFLLDFEFPASNTRRRRRVGAAGCPAQTWLSAA